MSFRRLSVVFLACVLAALSCTDGGTGPGDAGSTRLAVRPVYYASGAAFSAAAGEIQRIRLVARDAATEAEVLNRVFTIDPTQEEWRLQLDIPSTVTATSLVVTIELLSLVGELEVVEWSGKAGPFTLTPGKAQQQDVPVYPGPLDNLTVTGLTITDAAATLVEGDSALATAEVQTTGPAAAGIRLIWGSTDTTVLRVGASGMVRAVRPGTADVIVRAGPRADTASVRVRQRPTTMALSPTAAPLTYIGAEATFSARVLDPRGAPIDSVELAWSVADESVAQHVGNGVVRAAGRGTTTLAVELVGNAAIRATAAITVTQVPARMSVAPASVTLDARGATAELAAEVEDAGGHAIADLTVEWSSSDGRVATVSSAGVVTAVNDGAATITARTGSVSATSSVQVTRVARLLEAVAGDGQTGVVGAALPQAPVVRVADANGHGLGGVAVSFAAAQGSVANASAVTDSTGRASAGGWTLGTRAGPQSLEASAAGLSVSFSATAQPAAPAALSATAGDGQTGPVGSTLPVGPAVRVTDSFGNPVAGVTVAFAVGSGGGSVSPASAITDANGDASTSWTLGTRPGAYSMSAAAAGLTPVSFGATATAGAAAKVTAASATHQAGVVGSAVAEGPTVLVTDAYDNPVSGVAVTFSVAGGGSVDGGASATVATDAAGLAGVSWTLGTRAGAQSVGASAGDAGSVEFTADALAGELARILKVAGDAQSGAAGSTLPVAPQVIVTDAFGNPLEAVAVTFAVTAGGGSVASPAATSSGSGVASAGSWTLGPAAGENQLTASAGSLAPVTFTATGIQVTTPTLSLVSGNNQTAGVGNPVPAELVVRVLNGTAPVAGTAVTWAVTSGGGTITPAGTTTDADGYARASWQLGDAVGTHQATASAGGVTGSPVTFTATASNTLFYDDFDGENGGVGVASYTNLQHWTIASGSVDLFGNGFNDLLTGNGLYLDLDGAAGSATLASRTAFRLLPGRYLLQLRVAGSQRGDANVLWPQLGAETVGGISLQGTAPFTQVARSVLISAEGTGTIQLRHDGSDDSGMLLDQVRLERQTAAPGALYMMSGDGQTPGTDGVMPQPLYVTVRDTNGQPIAGVDVAWSASGGSTVSLGAAAATTLVTQSQSNGATSVSWTVIPGGTAQSVTASVAGLSPVTFSYANPCDLRTTHAPGTSVQAEFSSTDCMIDGRPTDMYVFTLAAATDLRLIVGSGTGGYQADLWRDGVSVFAAVGASAAELNQRLLLPAGNYLMWLRPLNATDLGAYTLSTVVNDADACEVAYLLRGVSGLTRQLTSADCSLGTPHDVATVHVPADSTLRFTTTSTIPVKLELRDPNSVIASSGLPATSSSMLFTAPAGGGSYQLYVLSGAAAQYGSYTLSVAADTRPAGATLQAGDAQTGPAGEPLSVAPAVFVHDASNQPVQGVLVSYAVTGGGGSISGALPVSGADGIARAGAWTLGPVAGANTLSATVQGIATPLAFTATGTVATPTISLSLGTRTFVGVSFTAPLTVSLNAPAPAGGVVVSVSSGDPTKLSVASPGTVTIAEGATSGTITLSGVAAGSVTLTGTATGYTSGSLSVPVSLRLISLPTTLNVPYGQTASLPIQLAEPAPAGGTVVTLASSDATRVEVQTPTVTIAAGSLTGNATVTGVLPGPATLTASATEYISGSSAATTTANLDIVETSVSLNASFGTSFTVRLRSAGVAVAAPSPGLAVTLTPFDETCATTPATVTIPTGLTQTVVAVSHGGGTTLPCSTRIRATAANIAPDSVTANVALTPGITLSGPITVGTGLQSSASGYLGASNHGGTTVRISSPDATKLLIAPNASTPGAAYLDIPLANGTSSFSYYVQALEAVLDTLQVTATATGFSAGTVTSYIVQPAFDIGGLSTSTMTLTPDDDFYARVGIPYSNLSGLYYTQALRAGSPGATVTFTVTDTTVARLAGASATAATATVTIAALQSNSPTSAGAGGVALRALSAGSVTVTGSMSGFAATTTSSRVVTITAPTITLSASTMGAGLQASGSGYLSASNHGGTTVRVSSPDASRLLIAPNATTPGAAYLDIAVPNGNTGFSYYLQALEGVNDTLLVTATAPGFTDGGTSVPIVPAAYDLAGLNSSTTTQTGDDPVYVRVGVPYSNLSGLYYTQPLRAGSPGLSATLSVADTSLARLVSLTDTAAASGTVAIAALQSNSPTTVAGGGIAVRPRAAGVASVSASIPGLVATAAATRSTTITAPVITVNSTTVGSGLQTSSNGYLGASAHGGVTVRVSSPDPTRLLISPNSTTAGSEYIDIAVPDGTTGFSYYLQAIEGGTDTLQVTASAPLFTSGAGTVRIVNAGIALTGLSSTLTTLSPDDPFQVQVGVPYDDLSGLYYQQALRAGGPAVNATLTSSRPAAQLVTAALTGGTVTVPVLAAGNSPSGGVALRPLTADTTRISASAPGFVTLGTSSRLVTISAPGITIYGATVGSGLQTSSSGSLGASEHAGVTVRITSSNSSVALVSPNATTAGTPYIDVPLAAGNTGFNFHIQGVEGATGTVTITASASGFTDGTTTVDVVTPGYQLAGLNTSANLAQGDDLFSVQVGIPYTNNTGLYYTQNVRAGAQPLEITLASGTPATALLVIGGSAVASGTVAIAPNSASTPSGLALRPVAAGTSTVTASIPGFIAQPNASMTVQVAEASITTTSGVTVGGGLQTTQSVTLSGSQHGGTTVRITSSDPARLLLAPNGTTAGAGEIDVFIANGSSSASFYVQGIEGATGSVPISMTATGFTSASPVVSVVQPAVDLSGLLTSMSATAANDPFTVRVGIPTSGLSGMSTFQQVRAGTSLVITVSSSNPAAGQLVTASATAGSVEVTIPAGATSSPTGAIAFAPLAAGSTAVSASRTGFASVLTSTVNVTVQ